MFWIWLSKIQCFAYFEYVWLVGLPYILWSPSVNKQANGQANISQLYGLGPFYTKGSFWHGTPHAATTRYQQQPLLVAVSVTHNIHSSASVNSAPMSFDDEGCQKENNICSQTNEIEKIVDWLLEQQLLPPGCIFHFLHSLKKKILDLLRCQWRDSITFS